MIVPTHTWLSLRTADDEDDDDEEEERAAFQVFWSSSWWSQRLLKWHFIKPSPNKFDAMCQGDKSLVGEEDEKGVKKPSWSEHVFHILKIIIF